MSKYEDILTAEAGEFKSLVFDFAQLNNTDEYIDAYGIEPGERMLCYAYSGAFFSFRMEGNGTIITDDAIYFHPSHTDWGSMNRLPLSDICKYMIFQESANDNVHLISEGGERRIFGRTVAPKDKTGKELVGLLQKLQRVLIRTDKAARHDFERTIGWMIGEIRASFRENGILNDRYKNLLEQIASYPFFVSEVCYLKAQHLYRLCDEGEYYRYVESLADEIDEGLLAKLRRPDEEFYEAYIADISNANAFYMTQSLIPSYINLKKQQRLTKHQCMILCFLCIRLEDKEYYDDVLSMIAADLDTEEFWLICGFFAKYKNEKMAEVYEKLLSKLTLTKAELSVFDALGLSPLHYAMILRDGELVRKILAARDWYDFKSPFLHDKLVDTVYDFVFLAASLFDDIALIEEVMLHTDRRAKPLLRARRQMDNFIDINEKMQKKKQDADASEEDISYYATRAAEYRAMRDEIAEEIAAMTKARIAEARKKAEIIIKTRHPLTRYILYMYLAPDAVYRSIADTITAWRIYRYKQIFFVTSLDHELELSYYEWQDGEVTDSRIIEGELAISEGMGESREHTDGDYYTNPAYTKRMEEERRKREAEAAAAAKKKRQDEAASDTDSTGMPMPYESSWFSPEAHRDLGILKKEYRTLVKKYHPDVVGEGDGGRIMLVIMSERADILEQMG